MFHAQSGRPVAFRGNRWGFGQSRDGCRCIRSDRRWERGRAGWPEVKGKDERRQIRGGLGNEHHGFLIGGIDEGGREFPFFGLIFFSRPHMRSYCNFMLELCEQMRFARRGLGPGGDRQDLDTISVILPQIFHTVSAPLLTYTCCLGLWGGHDNGANRARLLLSLSLSRFLPCAESFFKRAGEVAVFVFCFF